MRYDLRRRLEAAETGRCGSLRVAAIVRAIKIISQEELARQLANRTGLLDLTTLSDGELEWLIDEFKLLPGAEPSQVAEDGEL